MNRFTNPLKYAEGGQMSEQQQQQLYAFAE